MQSRTFDAAPELSAPKKGKRQAIATLQAMAYICIILGFLMYAGETVVQQARALTAPATGGLDVYGQSVADEATFTITNEKPYPQQGCMHAEVTPKVSTRVETAKTLTVCTGEMKPMTTVVLRSPYINSKVRELCSTKNSLDMEIVDSSLCNFRVVDTTGR